VPTAARVQELLIRGDVAGASTEALRDLGPGVLRYLRSVLQDEELAADAFSQFAENLWRGLPTFRGDASLRTWAFRIAWNVAASAQRDPWCRNRADLSAGMASGLADEIRTKTAVRRAREDEALDRLRQALTREEQSLLALRLDQGLSWAEIADVVSVDGERVQPATLMKRYERLKERMREMARREGLAT